MVTTTRATRSIDTPIDPKAVKVDHATLSLKFDEESGKIIDTKIFVDVSHDNELVQEAADSVLREMGLRE